MDAELVTIGTELLLGFTVDTNAAFLGQALAGAGVRVVRRTTVEDREGPIAEAVRDGLDRTGFVITSGGLGPTHDDVTKRAVAGLLEAPLEFDPRLWEDLVARFARLGRTLAERNRCQAEVPRGAAVLPNPRGTAPGLWLAGPPGEVVLLPGVPRELEGLVRDEVVPRLRGRGRGSVVQSLLVRTTGLPESALAERLAPLEPELLPLTFASLPGLDGVDLRLTAWDLPADRAAALLAEKAERIRDRLGDHVYAIGEADLAAVLLGALGTRGLFLGTAESCTGGMLGARITAVPGSSEVFAGGAIAYANRLKEDLGVPARILETHGAVSEPAAREMALAARQRFRVDVAISVTGVAGPGGGLEEKPVGLVWFGIADRGGVETHRASFPGSRHDIRARACQFALWKALLRVQGSAAGR